MPSSSGKGESFVKLYLPEIAPQKVIDVGCGKGNLVRRYRTPGPHWTGVEIFEPYIATYQLKKKYEKVICADAREVDYGVDTYDLAFAGDVLEHMSYEEAQALMQKLQRAAPWVIISIPLGYYPQGTVNGNMHERHITNYWDADKVQEKFGPYDYSAITLPVGTFIYRRKPCES